MPVEVQFRFRTHSGSTYQVEWQMGYWVTKVTDLVSPDWSTASRSMVCAADEFGHPIEGERFVVRYDGQQVLSTSKVVDVFYPRRLVTA